MITYTSQMPFFVSFSSTDGLMYIGKVVLAPSSRLQVAILSEDIG